MPEELKRIYENAKDKVGTLNKVVGGDCTSHSFCPSKFSCIGCPAKVPDPARKQEIVFQKRWALDSSQQYESLGLLPEATKLKQVVKDCDK